MANRLSRETSPYLLQHADNPVDWYPWGEEALARARAENIPILLSIGYSACHWCHVMAHESFEDAATARVMNERYVNIKVDREERPDLDKIYQLAHQALSQRGGGWPLTMFLAPDDLVPFFAGTYFPNAPRHGMPAFTQVLERVRRWYDEQPAEMRAQNAAMQRFLQSHARGPPAQAGLVLDDAPVAHALAQLARSFDPHWGGFGRAPKFPHATELELLSVTAQDGERDAARMLELTLTRMAEGGMHDQLGGGFCRYSVDARWEIPHFEKMLYDNAALLPLYAQAARSCAEPAYAAVAHGIAGFVARELTHADGAFHAALDADSEGEEGRYYVWQRQELEALLSKDELALAERRYGFDRDENFEGHAWNPIVARSIDSIAGELALNGDAVAERLETVRAKLFDARAKRVRPGLDDKILSSWNALMIAGLARGARLLAAPYMLARAERAVNYLRRTVWLDGRLYAGAKGDPRRFPAYLDDHAFLLDALLELLATRWRRADLDWAVELADALLARFEDREHGGFFFTAHDHEALVARQKPFLDESVPSGNGIATRALLRLGHLLGETRYLDAAERTLRAAAPTMKDLPHGCASLVLALRTWLAPPPQVVVRGEARDLGRWLRVQSALAPTEARVYVVADGAPLPGLLAQRAPRAGGIAYLCRGMTCQAPIADPGELVRAIRAR
ncbi:MAG TPA: thioredoxin domain-containing protein [Candidatus Saccharimonadia bacterium]|nr:thioredoxin domain-containing protein [Candidatus Saccharimonadia bacterium]